jgi:uncharacterized membrane protein
MPHARRLTILAILLLSTGWIQAQPRYTVTDLGAFIPSDLTETGMVCGSVVDATGERPAAVVGGHLSVLQVQGRANACNDAGHVVGIAESPPDGAQAFLWDAGGLHWLVGPKGETNSEATGVNASGDISVHFYTPLPSGAVRRVSSRIEDAIWVPLPSLSGGFDRAQGINDGGDVVMDSEAIDGQWHATIATDHGPLIDLGNIGFPGVQAINNAQQVAGHTTGPDGASHVFRAHPTEGVTTLPIPGGFTAASAADIDHDGAIVGTSSAVSPQRQPIRTATLWPPNQPPVELETRIDPTSGWELDSATAIRGGKIVGSGRFHGQPRGFLLTPVPPREPPSADVVALRQAVFVNRFGQLLVVATSSESPDATLALTVPGCLQDAPLTRAGSR